MWIRVVSPDTVCYEGSHLLDSPFADTSDLHMFSHTILCGYFLENVNLRLFWSLFLDEAYDVVADFALRGCGKR